MMVPYTKEISEQKTLTKNAISIALGIFFQNKSQRDNSIKYAKQKIIVNIIKLLLIIESIIFAYYETSILKNHIYDICHTLFCKFVTYVIGGKQN